jgi:hypothetical protein
MAARGQASSLFQGDASGVTHASPWVGVSGSFDEEPQQEEQQRHQQENKTEDSELGKMRAEWKMPTGSPHRPAPPRAHKPTPASVLRAFDADRELTLVEAAGMAPTEPSMYIWRCQDCPPEASVCCRIGDGRRCLCGHKSKDHDRSGHCRACSCKVFKFHVQFPGFELRCRCKHKHTDHAPRRGPNKSQVMKCTKCDNCADFSSAWTCNCGHGWASHVTMPYRGFLGPRAREWVVSGVSKEVVAEAKKKREQWARRGKLPNGASETAAAMALAAAAARYRRAKAQQQSSANGGGATHVIAPEALEEARAVLGMSKGNTATAAASADEVDLIRRAFKKSVLETHPDKGGSAELFQRVKDAHDVLIAAAT